MLRALFVGTLLLLCSACPAPPPGSDAGVTLDAGPFDAGDPGALFPQDRLVDVQVELPAADWDTLRNQTRDLFTLLAGDCTAQPFPSPFTTFEGTVTVEGQRLERATVKKKGFLGSLSSNRPSLKLKFDTFIDGQAVHGMDALTLNNAQQDPSVLRQCLAYGLFAKAGLLAPRCAFAHVRVNGADLGVYVHVEAIDKDFLRRRGMDPKGHLYEGTLSDFTPTFARTFDLKDGAPDGADIDAVSGALLASDADLLTRLEPLVDVDRFIEFWAMETLLRHWDGYAQNTNNFFVYGDPAANGRFVFIPWGADAALADGVETADNPRGLLLRGQLAQRLYALPATRDRYLARVRALLDGIFSEASLRAEVARLEALVSPALHPIQRAQFAGGLANLRAFIDGRRAALTAVLAAPPASMRSERPSPCLRPLGAVAATFATRWGTLGTDMPFSAGTGTLAVTLGDAGVPVRLVTSMAGLDTSGNDGPRVGVNVVAQLEDGGFGAVALRLLPPLYPPVGAQPFDLVTRIGVAFELRAQQVVPVALLGNGTMTFTQASGVDGGVVAGSFDAQLYSWPFGG